MKNNLINNSENLIEKKIDWLNIQNEMKSKFGSEIKSNSFFRKSLV